jgi:uncharacterized protein YodC (DUF2158 family)
MKVDDIVFLKSGSPKLLVEWLVGITQNPNLAFDPNSILVKRPNYQKGDIAVKWYIKDEEKKETFPDSSLIDNLANRQAATNPNLTLGCVVKNKLLDIEMTVVWIIGTPKETTSLFDANEIYKQAGQFNDGDVLCCWFDKQEYTSKVFKKDELEKLFD